MQEIVVSHYTGVNLTLSDEDQHQLHSQTPTVIVYFRPTKINGVLCSAFSVVISEEQFYRLQKLFGGGEN